MVSDRELSHVVGGKSARACDNCVRKRARWYCTADDAFLCESCDSSVHSANPLARRHERVRLKTASAAESSGGGSEERLKVCVPSWHEGFKKKARTPRRKKRGDPLRLVPEPELCSEEESEEQLLYRVPIFDPFKTDLETSFENYGEKMKKESKVEEDDFSDEMNRHLEGIILPSELDIAEFAADVESLLGKGLDEEAFAMEGLGILDCEAKECGRIAKDEDEDTGEGDGNCQIDVGREIFEMNFDSIAYEEEHKIESIWRSEHELDDSSKAFLKLNYDKVMSAWDEKKSPWTTGERPEFTYDEDWWRDCCLGTSGAMHAYGGVALGSGQAAVMGGGGREARVSRYREKRRTRLFSKKIRYEVRKLNAEKRPRMKGRFVKRASVAASAFPLLGNK